MFCWRDWLDCQKVHRVYQERGSSAYRGNSRAAHGKNCDERPHTSVYSFGVEKVITCKTEFFSGINSVKDCQYYKNEPCLTLIIASGSGKGTDFLAVIEMVQFTPKDCKWILRSPLPVLRPCSSR